MRELDHWERRRIHDLKYFTWVEQQGGTAEELDAQWYDEDYWTGTQQFVDTVDELIERFNERVAATDGAAGTTV